MQQRRVGTTGLQVSRLGLGLAQWGTAVDEHEAGDLLKSFLGAGGTLLDTAHSYGAGASEELLGRLLDRLVAREDVVLATKAGVVLDGGSRRFDASRRTLIQQLDRSLDRLGVDHVDLWQVHHFDEQAPVEETLSALDLAVSSGRASYVGISNFSAWRTAQAATWQKAVPVRAPLASTQMEYSLLNRAVEADVVPAAQALGLGLLPYSPLGRGVLTGKYRSGIPADSRAASDDPGRAASVEHYLDDRARRIVEAVARAADGLGWTPLQVALAWVRDRPGVVAPIIGPRTAGQLGSVLAAEDLTLPGELVAALDDVSGPEGG